MDYFLSQLANQIGMPSRSPSIWEQLFGLAGLDEGGAWGQELPWYGKIAAGLLSGVPNIGYFIRRFYGQQPWEERERGAGGGGKNMYDELQDIVKSAQQGEITSHPAWNAWLEKYMPEWIQPQEFTFQELAQRQHPEIRQMLSGLMRAPGAEAGEYTFRGEPMGLRDILTRTFETQPGEILRPELPAVLLSPEVQRQRAREQAFREEMAGTLKDLEIPHSYDVLKGLSGVLGPQGMRTVLPQMYPEDTTAYAQNLALKEKNRLEYMKLHAQFGGKDWFDEKGVFLGNPRQRMDYNRYKMLEQEFGPEKVKAPAPVINTRQLMSKLDPYSTMGIKREFRPKDKFQTIRPYEFTAPQVADSVYVAHGMPTRQLRERLIGDINEMKLGRDVESIRANLIQQLGYDEDVADWIIGLSRFALP